MAYRVLRTGGLMFDGMGDHVEIPLIGTVDEFTYALWVYPTGRLYKWRALINNKGWETGDVHCQFADLNQWEFAINGNTPSVQVATTWFGADKLFKWHHLAVAYSRSGAYVSFYVNGALDARLTYSVARSVSLGDAWIGGWDGGERWWKGIIGETRFYDRVLSSAEISDIYNYGTVIKDGLVLLLDFTEYEGTTAYDKSGLGNHGTIYGAEWVIKKAERV